jgi:MFS family permease
VRRNVTVTPLDALLDDAPLTRSHVRVWLLAAMGVMLDGFDFFIIGVATPLIAEDLDASSWEIGMISAAAIVGAIFGAFLLGGLTDRIGRQLAFKLDLGTFVVFAVASALAPTIATLILFRFLLGIGIGADYPISAAYVSEIAPVKHRSRLLVGAFSFQAVGQVLGAVVGLVILWISPDVGAWRWMLAAGVVPAIVIVFLRRGVPESPRWLASKGHTDEAAQVVAVFVGHPVDQEVIDASRTPDDPAHLRDLFAPDVRRRTVLTTVPWFLMDIATYGVGVFTPTILATLAITGDGTSLSDDIASTEGAVVLDLFLVVGFGLAIWLIERVRHTDLQIRGFAVMTAALLTLALASELPGGGDDHLWLIFLAYPLFNVFMNMGPNSTTFLLPAEVFPVRVRARGHGLAAACGKTGAAVGVLLFPVIQDDLGLGVLLVGVAVGCAIAGVITFVLRAEAPGLEGSPVTA